MAHPHDRQAGRESSYVPEATAGGGNGGKAGEGAGAAAWGCYCACSCIDRTVDGWSGWMGQSGCVRVGGRARRESASEHQQQRRPQEHNSTDSSPVSIHALTARPTTTTRAMVCAAAPLPACRIVWGGRRVLIVCVCALRAIMIERESEIPARGAVGLLVCVRV